jgi:hypothetical protein
MVPHFSKYYLNFNFILTFLIRNIIHYFIFEIKENQNKKINRVEI